VTEPIDPIVVASQVTAVFHRLEIPYTIGGSIASSLAGEPRSTLDIDIVVDLSTDQVPTVAAALEPAFYLSADGLRRAVRERGTVNLIHHETAIKVDLFIAGGTPIDQQQLARRQRVIVGDQVLFVHPPEDILLQKLRWFRKGGEVSDRQWRDIIGIVRTQGHRLDRAYLVDNARLLDVSDLLERALGDRA
jgi:hypothetical protein